MILQALQVMLFGMLGIFLVMGLIILAITLLKKIPDKSKKNEPTDSLGGLK